MKVLTSVLFASALFVSACSQANTNQPSNISTTTASVPATTTTNQAVKAEGVWIDVRTSDEYSAGHIDEAINIPFDEIADKIAQVTTDKNAPINLYCKSGRRAGIAKTELEKLGYTNVTNHGGYDDLVKQGLK